MSVEVSIITALYNRLDLTKSFLEDLDRTLGKIAYEVILVDDGSTDGTREFLQSLHAPHFRCFLNEDNLGYAGSNNRGASEAKAPILCFLNNDLVLHDGWFEPMRDLLDETTGAVGNVQLNAQTGRIDHAGIIFAPWGIPEHWGQNYLCIPKKGGRDFKAVTGACCVLFRSVFETVGGFDDKYRNGFEDIDFCLRLRESGLRNKVAFSSRVGHWISASPGRKDKDAANIRRFLDHWGEQTSKWGMADWPSHYLRRHTRNPWKLNGLKTLDALRMLIGLSKAPSQWMLSRAKSLREEGVP